MQYALSKNTFPHINIEQIELEYFKWVSRLGRNVLFNNTDKQIGYFLQKNTLDPKTQNMWRKSFPCKNITNFSIYCKNNCNTHPTKAWCTVLKNHSKLVVGARIGSHGMVSYPNLIVMTIWIAHIIHRTTIINSLQELYGDCSTENCNLTLFTVHVWNEISESYLKITSK